MDTELKNATCTDMMLSEETKWEENQGKDFSKGNPLLITGKVRSPGLF